VSFFPIVLLSAIVLLSGCGRSLPDARSVRVDQLFAEWNKAGSPGCAVGVSRNGVVVYEGGYGLANVELGVPITPATVLAVASVSKSFTAMSVLLAADRGLLSLDDEVQKHIPEWVDRDDHITIRHLLTHTSGVRDAFTLLGWAPENADPNESIVRMLARQRGLNFSPGTEYQYNNGGYNLLASIIRRATGQSLSAFADANIFTPLGMAHSSFQSDATALIPNRAPRYTKRGDGWHRVPEGQWTAIGNDGMYSTVGDLLRWEENFETRHVGTPQVLGAMSTPTVLSDGTTTTHAVGVGLSEYRGRPTVESSGGDYGIASKVVRFPNQHAAIAVLCNEDNIVMGGMARLNPDVLTSAIADIYLADALGPADATTRAAASPPRVKLSDAELSDKTGLYRIGGTEAPALITAARGSLMVRSYYADDFDLEITPVGGNRFELVVQRVPFEFIPATKGWRVGEGKDARVWELITWAPSAADIRGYAGEYRSDELGATYTLDTRDSMLVIRTSYGADIAVAPFSKDVFVGDVVGIMKFSRDRRGNVVAFTVNRIVARGVRFDRTKRVD